MSVDIFPGNLMVQDVETNCDTEPWKYSLVGAARAPHRAPLSRELDCAVPTSLGSRSPGERRLANCLARESSLQLCFLLLLEEPVSLFPVDPGSLPLFLLPICGQDVVGRKVEPGAEYGLSSCCKHLSHSVRVLYRYIFEV